MLKCLGNEPNLKNQSNVQAWHVFHKSLEIKYAHKTIINTNEFGHDEAHWIKGKTWMWSHIFIGRRKRKKEGRKRSINKWREKKRKKVFFEKKQQQQQH